MKWSQFDDSVQNRRNRRALAMELRLFCIWTSKYEFQFWIWKFNVAHWHEAHYSAILQSEYDSISFPNDMAFLAQQLK